MLLASVSLIIAAILSLRVLIRRLRMIWQARQRRLRINSIPTVKYSSSLIIAKDKLITIKDEIDEYDDSEDDEKHVNMMGNTTAAPLVFKENQRFMLGIYVSFLFFYSLYQ